jgi:hypothetical protein
MPQTYEEKMGTWVTARCNKRKNNQEQMPYYVKQFLDEGKDGDPADGTTAPITRVAGWLTQTVQDTEWDPTTDPDWPRNEPP